MAGGDLPSACLMGHQSASGGSGRAPAIARKLAPWAAMAAKNGRSASDRPAAGRQLRRAASGERRSSPGRGGGNRGSGRGRGVPWGTLKASNYVSAASPQAATRHPQGCRETECPQISRPCSVEIRLTEIWHLFRGLNRQWVRKKFIRNVNSQ